MDLCMQVMGDRMFARMFAGMFGAQILFQASWLRSQIESTPNLFEQPVQTKFGLAFLLH